jgi:hypothetical protein
MILKFVEFSDDPPSHFTRQKILSISHRIRTQCLCRGRMIVSFAGEAEDWVFFRKMQNNAITWGEWE